MTALSRTGLTLAIAFSLSLGLAACQRSAESPADATANATSEEQAEARPSRQYAIEEFIESVGVGGASFSADESRILFSSNKSGVWNAYTMPVGGGEWTALARDSKSRPEAGIVIFEHKGFNQKGELVFSFEGKVLTPKRPG